MTAVENYFSKKTCKLAMVFLNTAKITVAEALDLIEEARNLELCRDIAASRRILQRVWTDFDGEPDVAHLPPAMQAEILRLCGFLLSYYGRSRSLRDYQERGKNFLTRAIEIFTANKLTDKASESKVMLAQCYWYEGGLNECEMILATLENEYAGDRLSAAYIQICVNRLMIHYWKQEFTKAVEFIELLAIPVEFCTDLRLKTMYHNQAGVVYRKLNKGEKALFHLNAALKPARRSGNKRFCAIIFNNLGNVYKILGRFEMAHEAVDEAIRFYTQIEEPGWLAHILDTKAQVYLAQGETAAALDTIEESLKIFRVGEDYAGFADALAVKCEILVRLDRLTESLLSLFEAVTVAESRIGEFAVQKYLENFAALVYPLKKNSYPEEVRSFKKNLLTIGIKSANLQVTQAARDLGITHQNLSDILNNQFPELADELGVRRRANRAVKSKKKTPSCPKDFATRISPLSLRRAQIVAGDGLILKPAIKYLTFVINARQIPGGYKVSGDLIALVEPTDEQIAGMPVIVQNIWILKVTLL